MAEIRIEKGTAMTIKGNLKFLAMSNAFNVEECEGGRIFFVRETDSDNDLVAVYDAFDGEWKYYVTDCYNCSCENIEIDMEGLARLKSFCEALSGSSLA